MVVYNFRRLFNIWICFGFIASMENSRVFLFVTLRIARPLFLYGRAGKTLLFFGLVCILFCANSISLRPSRLYRLLSFANTVLNRQPTVECYLELLQLSLPLSFFGGSNIWETVKKHIYFMTVLESK